MLVSPIFSIKSFIGIILSLTLLASLPLLTSCESEQDKLERQKKENTAKVMAPRKEKIDPRKAAPGGPIGQ